jgi:hypothetical protein
VFRVNPDGFLLPGAVPRIGQRVRATRARSWANGRQDSRGMAFADAMVTSGTQGLMKTRTGRTILTDLFCLSLGELGDRSMLDGAKAGGR